MVLFFYLCCLSGEEGSINKRARALFKRTNFIIVIHFFYSSPLKGIPKPFNLLFHPDASFISQTREMIGLKTRSG